MREFANVSGSTTIYASMDFTGPVTSLGDTVTLWNSRVLGIPRRWSWISVSNLFSAREIENQWRNVGVRAADGQTNVWSDHRQDRGHG